MRIQWDISRDTQQGEKVSWSKGVEITRDLFSSHSGIMFKINIKRNLKITHMFSNAVGYLLREVFDLAIESLKKVKMLKKLRR